MTTSLPRFLRLLFTVFEIVIVVGTLLLLSTLVIFRVTRTWDYSCAIGRVGLTINPAVYHLDSTTSKHVAVSVDDLSGRVLIRPAGTGSFFSGLFLPLFGSILCKSLMSVCLCDLLRRLFRGVERRDVFSAAEIRNIRKMGALIVALAVVSAILGHWSRNYSWEFVNKNITAQGALGIQLHQQPSNIQGALLDISGNDPLLLGSNWTIDFRGILLGLVLIGLSEALRQGLALREENELTV
jgi:hypothetical protein